MKALTPTAMAAIAAAALLLGGCGQKGPLYLPSPPKAPVPAAQNGGATSTPQSQTPNSPTPRSQAPSSQAPNSQIPNSQTPNLAPGATPPTSQGEPQG